MRWEKIYGTAGKYSINKRGQIRINKTGKFMKEYTSPQGYSSIVLTMKNGTKKFYYIHYLVARAFLGKRPKGMVIHHRDGFRCYNHINNLKYVTYKENARLRKKLIKEDDIWE